LGDGAEEVSVVERLSSVRGERDNIADIALAEDIVRTKDTTAIRELVEHLHEKNARLQGDCIKTLYEVGEREPKLIGKYADEFASLLTSKNQRLVWGAVTALDACAGANSEGVYAHLDAIIKAANGESVIARDHAVKILVKLSNGKHADECTPILFKIIKTSPVNQLPTYGEEAETVMKSVDRKKLAKLLQSRVEKVEGAKLKRMQKTIKKLEA
jgi:hypothetical protein